MAFYWRSQVGYTDKHGITFNVNLSFWIRCITSLYHPSSQQKVSVLCTWCHAISIYVIQSLLLKGTWFAFPAKQRFFINLNLTHGRKTMKTFQCLAWWKIAFEICYCIACIKLMSYSERLQQKISLHPTTTTKHELSLILRWLLNLMFEQIWQKTWVKYVNEPWYDVANRVECTYVVH